MVKRRKRVPKSDLQPTSRFELLPEDIITSEIFGRLPDESIVQCRGVCKTWRHLIHEPLFVHMHLQRQVGQGMLFLIQFSDKNRGNVYLYYGEYDENNIDEQFSYKKLKQINHPSVKPKDRVMVGSCNGLICFSVLQYPIYDPIYICNPITREYLSLPKLRAGSEYWKGHMVSGFGFDPSSNKYKVIRIYYNFDQSFGRVEVYTLGDGKGWRKKGKITWSVSSSDHYDNYPPPSPGVPSNGTIYWLNKERKIVAFDLADEEFHIVTPPPCFSVDDQIKLYYKHCFQLRELGGHLCVVHQERGIRVDIWSLMETKGSSTCNMKEQAKLTYSWSKKFSMKWEGPHENEYEPFALTRSGEVLLWYNHKILSRYDPNTSTLTKLVVDDGTGLKFFQGFAHMNSFVSLKALGEKCKTRRKYMCARMMGSGSGQRAEAECQLAT